MQQSAEATEASCLLGIERSNGSCDVCSWGACGQPTKGRDDGLAAPLPRIQHGALHHAPTPAPRVQHPSVRQSFLPRCRPITCACSDWQQSSVIIKLLRRSLFLTLAITRNVASCRAAILRSAELTERLAGLEMGVPRREMPMS